MHPILFKIGSVNIYSWGLMVAISILIAIYLIYKNSAREGFDSEKILDGAFWTILLGFIGARAVFVIFNFSLFKNRPLEIFYIWEGGLAIYGAFLTGIPFAIFYCKKNKINFLKIMDLVTPFVALAYGIGRIGCFLNGCCYGKISSIPWAMQFPNNFGARHPTQLYSSFFGFLLFGFLFFFKKRKKFDGQIFLAGLIIYSIYRFFLEFVREDIPYFFYGLNSIQLGSIFIFIFSSITYFFQKKHKQN